MRHTLGIWTGVVITGAASGMAARVLGASVRSSVNFGICAAFAVTGLALVAFAIAAAARDGDR